MTAATTLRCDNCAATLSPEPGAAQVVCRHCGATLALNRPSAEAAPALSRADEEALAHLRAGQKIEAIRSYRIATGVGLLEAKTHVEDLARRNGLDSPGLGTSGGGMPAGCIVAAVLLVVAALFWLAL